jgi:hypothetical protein
LLLGHGGVAGDRPHLSDLRGIHSAGVVNVSRRQRQPIVDVAPGNVEEMAERPSQEGEQDDGKRQNHEEQPATAGECDSHNRRQVIAGRELAHGFPL